MDVLWVVELVNQGDAKFAGGCADVLVGATDGVKFELGLVGLDDSHVNLDSLRGCSACLQKSGTVSICSRFLGLNLDLPCVRPVHYSFCLSWALVQHGSLERGMMVSSLKSWQSRPVWNSSTALLWHGCGLVACLALASVTAWATPWFWQLAGQPGYGGLLGLCIFAYSGAAMASARLNRFGRTDGFSMILSSTIIVFAVILGVLVFARWYYSRSFLLVAFGFTLVWQLVGWRLSLARTPRLAVVPLGLGGKLLELPQVNAYMLTTPGFPVQAEAVAVDLHQPLSLDWQRFLAECALRDVPVHHAASVLETFIGRVPLESLSVETVESFAGGGTYPFIKRICDVLVVLVASPLLLLAGGMVALLVRLDSRGPVLFWQKRVGMGGAPFYMVKFRSMRVDAERDGQRFASSNDDRVTRVGRIIRKYRLDELPQFWNVLRGEMSIIGPRPEQVSFAERFAEQFALYTCRHLVRPGISGWAQVTQGYAANDDETRAKLEHDLYYVKHLSIWLDALVVYRTIRVMLSGFGAR